MRESFIMVVVLTIVCLLSALSLTLVNNITADRIVEQRQKETLQAVASILPRDELNYDNDLGKDIINIPEWTEKDGTPKAIYVGKHQGKVVGVAFTSFGEGYSSFITIMIGIGPNEKIIGIEIIEHQETPGLGSKIENPQFKYQFKGKSAEGSQDGNLVIIKGRNAKNSWEVEALTGATISPLGVVHAVNDGLAKFRLYKNRIINE